MEKDFFRLPAKCENRSPARNITPADRSGQGREEQTPAFTSRNLSDCSTREARAHLDYGAAVRLKALPLGVIKLLDRQILTVAVRQEQDFSLYAALKFAAGLEVKLLQVDDAVLDEAIFRAYHGDEGRLISHMQQLKTLDDKVCEPGDSGKFRLDFRPQSGEAAQFLAALIDYAISHNASDIHIIPTVTGAWVKLRVDGILLEHQGAVCSLPLHQQLISRIKVLSGLDITRKQTPQDGAFQVPVAGSNVHVRVSVMPTVHGEKAVLRLLGCEGLIPLDGLGLAERALSFIEGFMQRSEGAVLFAGPTGSGKTTTMYAVMQKLKARCLSLVSVEDPVEIHLEGVSQTSLSEQLGLGYAACLRSILRQDPDVILLGEIRDEDSALIAFQAALTGHLLLSTVHARSAAEVFLRLRSLKLDDLSLAQGVNLVICQRLLPKLCKHCRVVDLNSTHFLKQEVFQPVGCRHCDYAGFDGRALATEALRLEAGLSRRAATGEIAWQDLPALAGAEHYSSMQLSLETLLKNGDITMSQYLSICGE